MPHEVFEGLYVPEALKLFVRDWHAAHALGLCIPEEDVVQFLGILERKRLEKHSIQGAESRGRHAQAYRQGNDSQQRQSWTLEENSKSV